jgi:hypothetical protein
MANVSAYAARSFRTFGDVDPQVQSQRVAMIFAFL